jgi:tRNA pseudouridine55 synthase
MTESGLVIVDKPGGMTSHDVVARVRRLAGTRRVGHAGTLDPMATGVLVVGVEKATRLLGHLTLTVKTYSATIRLGQSTTTDDAEGSPVPTQPAAGVTPDVLAAAVAALTGPISQIPPGVSAIKVNGQRAYKLTRAGAAPSLAARPVTVYSFSVTSTRSCGPGLLDMDAVITCSSGTYIRALARDLGAALGTGGHLTALRRTQVGPYAISTAHPLATLDITTSLIPLSAAAAASFPRRDLTEDETRHLSHGRPLPAGPHPAATLPAGPHPDGVDATLAPNESAPAPSSSVPGAPIAAFAPDGTLVALLEEHAGLAKPIAVFAAG